MVQLFTASSAQKVANIKIAGGSFEEGKKPQRQQILHRTPLTYITICH